MARTEKKEDLRVRKTNKMLGEAITELLQTKSIDKISVVELCDAAQIHRATFYKHYKDKNAFIEHVISLQLARLYEEAKRNISEEGPLGYVRAITGITLDFVDRNRNFILSNTQSAEAAQLLIMISDILAGDLKYLMKKGSGAGADEGKLDVVSHYLSGGFIDVISWWLRSDSAMTREDLIGYIEKLLIPDNSFVRYYI